MGIEQRRREEVMKDGPDAEVEADAVVGVMRSSSSSSRRAGKVGSSRFIDEDDDDDEDDQAEEDRGGGGGELSGTSSKEIPQEFEPVADDEDDEVDNLSSTTDDFSD